RDLDAPTGTSTEVSGWVKAEPAVRAGSGVYAARHQRSHPPRGRHSGDEASAEIRRATGAAASRTWATDRVAALIGRSRNLHGMAGCAFMADGHIVSSRPISSALVG